MHRLLLPSLALLFLGNDGLIGTWKPVEAELAGVKLPEAVLAPLRLDLGKGTYVVRGAESPDRGTVGVDASKRPATMDIEGEEGPYKGKVLPAIYERKGDVLKICCDLSGKFRPTEFKTAKGTRLYLAVYQREK